MNGKNMHIDALLEDCKTPDDVDKLYSQLLQKMVNRGLSAELDAHLGYDKAARSPGGKRANNRNGHTDKTVKGTFGELEIATRPRWQLRTPAGEEAPDSPGRYGRQYPDLVCQRSDHA